MKADPEPRGSVPAAGTPSVSPAAIPPFPITIWDILLIAACGTVFIVLGAVGLGWLARSGQTGSTAWPAFDPTYAVLALEAVAIVASVYLFANLRRQLSWADIGLRPMTARQIRRAVIVGLFCFVVVTPILAGINALMNQPVISPQAPFVVGRDGFTWSRFLLMLALGGMIVPFAEELFFRGLVYTWMRGRLGVGSSVFASALVFGLAHVVFPMVAVGAFLVGLALALVYERNGTLWAPVAVHAVFNTLNLSVMFAGSAYIEAIT